MCNFFNKNMKYKIIDNNIIGNALYFEINKIEDSKYFNRILSVIN